VKNANIFVDVDLTLVDQNGNLIEGASDSLQVLKEKGCHLYLWSTAGGDYARSVAERHQLAALFEGYAPKPDIVIDDMPATVLNVFVFNPNEEESWESMANKIVAKHLK
jgi:ribonucleotide monophosphatase NagD (HAD superfamily)